MSDTKELIERLNDGALRHAMTNPAMYAALREPAEHLQRLLSISEAQAAVIARLGAERDAALADARLAAYVRGQAEPAPDGWRIDVWISGAPSIETIDEALSAAMEKP